MDRDAVAELSMLGHWDGGEDDNTFLTIASKATLSLALYSLFNKSVPYV